MAETTNIDADHQKERRDPDYFSFLHVSVGLDGKPAALKVKCLGGTIYFLPSASRHKSEDNISTQSRQIAKTQRGKPQPKNMSRSEQRKQRAENSAKMRNFRE
jgi:hypothetical protein